MNKCLRGYTGIHFGKGGEERGFIALVHVDLCCLDNVICSVMSHEMINGGYF